jgi:hypothetical protein
MAADRGENAEDAKQHFQTVDAHREPLIHCCRSILGRNRPGTLRSRKVRWRIATKLQATAPMAALA